MIPKDIWEVVALYMSSTEFIDWYIKFKGLRNLDQDDFELMSRIASKELHSRYGRKRKRT